MVKEIKHEGMKLFACDVCKFVYKEKKMAEACQTHCTKYNACSLEITKHAVTRG